MYFEEEIPIEYRFNLSDSEQWIPFLQEKGFVVVSNIISREEATNCLREMKKVICKFGTSMKIDDENSWMEPNNYPPSSWGGIMNYVGHTKFQWFLREKAVQVFTKLWDVDEMHLATSFDGMCYLDPRKNYKPKSLIENVHSDQSPYEN